MDIDALKTFLEVNRTRHFGQAAQNLYVSQSTVSARIRLLEEQIGQALFIRQRNNIQLTEAGSRLLRYAENIVTNWVRAKQEISIADTAHVPLVVGASTSLWDSLLQEWIDFLYHTIPGIVINAEVQSPDTLLRRTLERSMDIAFAFDDPQASELECIELTHVPLLLVSSQANYSVKEAMQDNYILVDWGTSFANAHARHFSEAPAPVMRVMLARLARDLLLSRGGSAYITEPMVMNHIEKGELYLVKDAPVFDRVVYALYHHDHHQPELIRQACDFFKQSHQTSLYAVE